MFITAEERLTALSISAHAGSRTRVTSMGGLYDAATLHALLCSYCKQTTLCMTSFGCMGNSSRLGRTRHCCSSPRAAGLDRQATWHGAMGSCAADARTLSRGRAHMAAAVRRAPGDMLLLASPEAWQSCSGRKRLSRRGGGCEVRMPGVEPGSQAWEACMIPLHYMRCCASIAHRLSCA